MVAKNKNIFASIANIIIFIAVFWTLSAFAGQNGTIKWKYPLDAVSKFGTVAIGKDGTIYTPSADKLLSIRPNGTFNWAFKGSDTTNISWVSIEIGRAHV